MQIVSDPQGDDHIELNHAALFCKDLFCNNVCFTKFI